MSTNLLFIGLISIIAALFLSTPVHAYLDPGTGSIILQGVLAAIAAVAVVSKLYWQRILRFLGLSKKDSALEQKTEGSENKS